MDQARSLRGLVNLDIFPQDIRDQADLSSRVLIGMLAVINAIAHDEEIPTLSLSKSDVMAGRPIEHDNNYMFYYALHAYSELLNTTEAREAEIGHYERAAAFRELRETLDTIVDSSAGLKSARTRISDILGTSPDTRPLN